MGSSACCCVRARLAPSLPLTPTWLIPLQVLPNWTFVEYHYSVLYTICIQLLSPLSWIQLYCVLKVSIAETILGDPGMGDLRLVVLVLKSLNDPTFQYSVSNILTNSIYDPQYPTWKYLDFIRWQDWNTMIPINNASAQTCRSEDIQF
jgi:hypothetical protein